MAKKVVNTNNELSIEQRKNIDNYKNDFKSITDDMERVRERPGMYIGPIESAGFLNMIREIFQNCLDQLLSPKSPCNYIKFIYDMRTETITLSDNGMGIPFELMFENFTVMHTGKNFVKSEGDYSAGLNGVGAKAVNALSNPFIVISYKYDGTAKKMIFEKGVLKKNISVSNPDKLQGTNITFTPDHEIMGDTTLESSIVYTLLRDLVSLVKIGTSVDYNVIYPNGKSYSEVIKNEDGIITNLIAKCETMVVPPIIVSRDTGFMKLDVAFTFDSKYIDGERLTAFANMCPTSLNPSNTHVSGFLDGVTAWFVKYMNNVYLGEKSKLKMIANDVKAGLAAMISAFHLNPQFTGQAKEMFSNRDFKPFAKQTTMDGLDEWCKSHPQDLQKVCKFLKEVGEIRTKTESEKIKVSAKYNKNALTGLPQKYSEPIGPASAGWELFIVEGDSAKTSAIKARNPKTQGIFPVRGKVLNVFAATNEKINNNSEIMGIANILGAGMGKSFDITKVKFKKIIFMTDADADGHHISALLLLLFLKYFPGLVESGMVYKAVPPLYGYKERSKLIFFSTRADFSKFMQKKFYTSNTAQFIDGVNISPSKFASLLTENEDYTYQVEVITNRYNINPGLLEIILESHLLGDNYTQFKKKVISNYRFINDNNIEKVGKTIKIKGLIGDQVQTVIYNERFVNECKKIIPYIQSAMMGNGMRYIINKNVTGLYDTLKGVENSFSSITRYKGLGEMDGEDLEISTMSPENRMLIRYTTDNIKEDIIEIRKYQSNKKKILAKISEVRRSDLIE